MLGPFFAIVLLFGGLAYLVAQVDGLTFLAPKSTKGISASVGTYCTEQCRLPDGRCPLTGTAERAANCPLWAYVGADVSTMSVGNPFGTAHAA